MLNKIERIEKHLERHPHDYQSVISLYKARSDQCEYEKRQERIKSLKLLSEIRRKRYEQEHSQ